MGSTTLFNCLSYLDIMYDLKFSRCWLLIIFSRTITWVVVSWKLNLHLLVISGEGHWGKMAEGLGFQEATTQLLAREDIINTSILVFFFCHWPLICFLVYFISKVLSFFSGAHSLDCSHFLYIHI